MRILCTKYDADTTDGKFVAKSACFFCNNPVPSSLVDVRFFARRDRTSCASATSPYIISTKSSEFAQSKTDQDYFSEKQTRESLASKLIPPKVEPALGVAGGSEVSY